MSLDLRRWYFREWFIVVRWNPSQIVVICLCGN